MSVNVDNLMIGQPTLYPTDDQLLDWLSDEGLLDWVSVEADCE